MINNFYFWCQKVLPLVYDDSLSYLEAICKISAHLNLVVSETNNLSKALEDFEKWAYLNFETKENITINRHLSENGDFTGTLLGKSIKCILLSIADSLTLAKTLIDTVNHRESIGIIYDGGAFNETDPIINDIDGGSFWDTKVIIPYNINCIRPDYILGECNNG